MENKVMTLEPKLVESAYFLQPASFITSTFSDITAGNYDPYNQILKEGGVIGYFNTRFEFVPVSELNIKYESRLPVIAESMLNDTKDADHKNFHVASLERGSLELFYEWDFYKFLGIKHMSIFDARSLRDAYGLLTLIVCRPELPTYDIILPEGATRLLEMKTPKS